MSSDPQTEFDQSVLDMIEHSPVGAVPNTPAHQDALKRLYQAQQVYAHADHGGGHVTARSLTAMPSFYPDNLEAFVAGTIADEALESNASVYDRYVQSLPAGLREAAERQRVTVIGKPVHHRAKHGEEVVHDPLHMLFLVPGGGPHPGLPGNYLHGAVFHVGADGATGAWVVQVHDADDGATVLRVPSRSEALARLEDVLACAPFHLSELAALGFVEN